MSNIKYSVLRGKGDLPNKRVIAIEDIYNTVKRVHMEQNHCCRTGLYTRLSMEFHGIPRSICQTFVNHCEICQLKKSRKSLKSLVINPISSSSYLSRSQIDLIDFSTVFPEINQPYNWLVVYQDHFTKIIRLRPLKRKCAEEVVEFLMDVFCELGPPLILQSDNEKEFNNSLLFQLINEKWPTTKIIRGKRRHPESQGSVERANQDIKKHFTTMMLENKNDANWVKYVRLVQYRKNTNYHSTIGMTPFQAIFNMKPPIGLSEFGIPIELGSGISTEEDLDRTIQEMLVIQLNCIQLVQLTIQ